MDGDSTIRGLQQVSADIRRAIQAQTNHLVEILATIKKLPELMREQSKSISEGFQHSIQAQFSIAASQHYAQIAARKQQLRDVKNILDEHKRSADQQIAAAKDRLQKRLVQIDNELDDNIRSLDRAVLELGETKFPSLIFNPMSETVAPFWDAIHESSTDSALDRAQVFRSVMGGVTERLREYEGQWASLRDGLPGLEYLSVGDQQALVPVCIITTEENGKTQDHIFVTPVWDADKKRIESGQPWLEKLYMPKICDNLSLFRERLKDVAGAFTAQKAKTADVREYAGNLMGQGAATAKSGWRSSNE
ncbi:hypothetical protein JW859_14570 [bacterium]|nr:hypothetical protein [bacterium]